MSQTSVRSMQICAAIRDSNASRAKGYITPVDGEKYFKNTYHPPDYVDVFMAAVVFSV